jgi:cytoskeleton-associated protein 5
VSDFQQLIHVSRGDSALFKLLQALALELTEGDSEQDFKAKHAELILKCIWKRSRTTEDDLRKGIITEEDIFTIIEEFLQVITPKQWRIRAAKKVPLGDMPLRTVKVLIQHTIGE